jgi:hypothetical protein
MFYLKFNSFRSSGNARLIKESSARFVDPLLPKVEEDTALTENAADQLRGIEAADFKEKPVLTGRERPIVEQKIHRIVRMVIGMP